MQYLKQSTVVTLKIGPFLDDTDGKTAETALSIAQADVRLSKNGANIAQKAESTSCTHDELGIYGCPIDATDTNTLGRLQLFIHESGALPVWHEYMILPANVYDSMFSTDKLEIDLLQMGGVAQSATDLKDFADAGYDPSSNKIEGCKVNDDMVGTASAALASVCTEARLAHLDADITTRSTHTAANVWSVGTRALTDKANFSLSTAGILAVWHQLTANIVTADTIGKLLKDNINATISSRSSHNAAAIWSAGSRALSTPNDYKADVSSLALEATLTAMKGATFAEATDSLEAIRNQGDAAWITAVGFSTHTAANVWEVGTRTLTGKTGFSLSSAGITAIWEKNISAYVGAGYAGTYLKTLYTDWLNAGRLDLILDAIAVDVAGLNGDAMRGTDSASLASICTEGRLSELDAASMPTDIDAILADTGTDGVIVASGSKTGYDLSAAGVDAILDDVVEGATTFRQMLRIFMSALGGKSSGGGTVTLTFRDIADGKDRITATVDANGNRTAMTLDGT